MIGVPYLLIRKLRPPIPVVWNISRSPDDQNKFAVSYVNALSGTPVAVVIHELTQKVTVFKALRKLAMVYAQLKQCSPFQKFVSADSIASNAMMFDTDPVGVKEGTWIG